ncbi:AAA family ATPase [Metabacillus iocasae]|uniref:Nuclease SbcCD subunit C n=1 Tax=Priestia iocasae TaxID=2291674 RepID=A0ABS2QXT5_9BACI|nr:AAA family ATPase [Metabacillus iocasae]MBM7703546.1 DNA sulfur modification protein DndD [Metabacillus iocasae]
MFVRKITFENFRQFYGEQQIEFAQGVNDRIVTVILGENGRGKTGIYRGVLFGLYGDRALEQDSDGKEDIILTNIKKLEEDAKGARQGVTSSVTIELVHEGTVYTIKRTLLAYQEESGKIIEQIKEVSLTYKEQVITDKEQVQAMVNDMLDERVKNYFFFDGERIERLTRASDQQRKEIAVGIRNLLKIDELIKSESVLQQLNKKLLSDLEKTSTGDYKKKLKEQLVNDEQIEQLQYVMNEAKDKLVALETELKTIDAKLSTYKEDEQLLLLRKSKEEMVEQKRVEYMKVVEHLQQFNQVLSLIMAKDALYVVKSQLEHVMGTMSEKEEIDLALIQKLLHDLTCICGTSFNKGSKEYAQLQSLESRVENRVAKQEHYVLLTEINQLIGYLDGKEAELAHRLEHVQAKQQEVEGLEQELEQVNKRLVGSDSNEIAQLNQKRTFTYEEKVHLEHALTLHESDLDEHKQMKEQIELALRDLRVKSGVHEKLAKKQEAVQKSLTCMSHMIKEFERKVVAELEQACTENLAKLLDESGRMNIHSVQVKNDYSIEVLNSYGRSFLANISQGQRQVLSLSFITALAQVAGNSAKLDLPLFMDTPFGRLSSQHEENLLSFLPQVCSQWVLLVTDREFGERESELFLQNRCWGKFYMLESVEPGVTQIIQRPPGIVRSRVSRSGGVQ